MVKSKIFKRLYENYTGKFIGKIFLAAIFSVIVAVSTSATAWLLDPAIEKIFINKDQALIILIPLAIIIAFNWNRVFDPTGIENDFFIPNITKISVLVIFLAYLFLRGVVLPMRKGSSLKFIFPLNFILISIMSFLLDLTKTIAYGYSKFFRT